MADPDPLAPAACEVVDLDQDRNGYVPAPPHLGRRLSTAARRPGRLPREPGRRRPSRRLALLAAGLVSAAVLAAGLVVAFHTPSVSPSRRLAGAFPALASHRLVGFRVTVRRAGSVSEEIVGTADLPAGVVAETVLDRGVTTDLVETGAAEYVAQPDAAPHTGRGPVWARTPAEALTPRPARYLLDGPSAPRLLRQLGEVAGRREGTERVAGVRTTRYRGVLSSVQAVAGLGIGSGDAREAVALTSAATVEVWLDDAGALRRVIASVAVLAPAVSAIRPVTETVEVEFSDLGTAEVPVLPDPAQVLPA